MSDAHDPATFDLTRLGDEVLEAARRAPAGRSAQALIRGPGAALTQTLLGLLAGRELSEHESPGPATLQVLRGRVELHAGDHHQALEAGEWCPIPRERHSLESHEDAVVLLTVAAENA